MGLTTLGIVHTAISLIALLAGIFALIRYREISPVNRAGRVYIFTTVLTCLTAFGIFQHGGFNEAHALGIITLLVLGVAALAGKTRSFGRASRYVGTVCYSATFFFHLIPAVTETATRLPAGAPLVPDRESPVLAEVNGVLLVLFVTGAALQVRMLRAGRTVTSKATVSRTAIFAKIARPRQTPANGKTTS